MSKTAKWILGIIAFLVVLIGLVVLSVVFWIFSDDNDETTSTSGDKVAVVELKETIVSSEDVVRQFKKYRRQSFGEGDCVPRGISGRRRCSEPGNI